MQTSIRGVLGRLALLLPAMLLAGSLQAGAKVKVKGSVEEVVEKVDVAFEELELDTSDIKLEEGWAEAWGMNQHGAHLRVAVKRLGQDECEVEFSGEDSGDGEIEERFLRLMQTR